MVVTNAPHHSYRNEEAAEAMPSPHRKHSLMFIALLYFSRGRALLVAGGGDGVGRDQRA